MGGGYNWLDGKGMCTVGVGDKYLIKFEIDATGASNTSGAAGSLAAESWLTTVGTLQARSDSCKCVLMHEYVYVCVRMCTNVCTHSFFKGIFLHTDIVTTF